MRKATATFAVLVTGLALVGLSSGRQHKESKEQPCPNATHSIMQVDEQESFKQIADTAKW